MLDRLVELLYRAHHNASCVLYEGGSEDEVLEEEARYLLKYGVIVPPCKVGDTLWINWDFENTGKKTYPVKVYALRFDTKKNNMRICVESNFLVSAYGGYFTHHYLGTFPWGSVGKTVFLTREEAEQALLKP